MKNKAMMVLFVIAVLLLGIAISAYSLIGSTSEDESYNISIVVENSQNEKWNSFRAGAESAAADYNAIIDFVSTSDFDSSDDQFVLIERQISGGANAVVTELVGSDNTADKIKDMSGKAVIALTGTGAQTDIDIEGKFATITPDNYQIGRALGNEILLRHQMDLSDLTVGIVCKRAETDSVRDRIKGIYDVFDVVNADVSWCVIFNKMMTADTESKGQIKELITANQGDIEIYENAKREDNLYFIKRIYKDKPVDILISLDDESLQISAELYGDIENAFTTKYTAFKYKVDEDGNLLPPFELYGEGTSIKNISYLDRGRIVSMIVPNEFRMGYEAVEKSVSKLKHKLSPMEDEMVEYRVINQENIFKDDNQKYLFTTIQ